MFLLMQSSLISFLVVGCPDSMPHVSMIFDSSSPFIDAGLLMSDLVRKHEGSLDKAEIINKKDKPQRMSLHSSGSVLSVT